MSNKSSQLLVLIALLLAYTDMHGMQQEALAAQKSAQLQERFVAINRSPIKEDDKRPQYLAARKAVEQEHGSALASYCTVRVMDAIHGSSTLRFHTNPEELFYPNGAARRDGTMSLYSNGAPRYKAGSRRKTDQLDRNGKPLYNANGESIDEDGNKVQHHESTTLRLLSHTLRGQDKSGLLGILRLLERSVAYTEKTSKQSALPELQKDLAYLTWQTRTLDRSYFASNTGDFIYLALKAYLQVHASDAQPEE